jgi:cell division protein FtsZ
MFKFLNVFKKKEEDTPGGTLVIGCGGGGCNIVNRLGRISGVELLTVNTDRKGLIRTRANRRILLGDGTITAGCDGNVEMGVKLTKFASDTIEEYIKKHTTIVLVAGLGGGTGTGAIKVISEMAKKNGSRVIVMVTLPMSFEAGRRKTAMNSLNDIKRSSDVVLILDGDRLMEIDPAIGAREALSLLDQMICESFLCLMEMLDGENGESTYQTIRDRTMTASFAEGMNVEKVAKVLANGIMAHDPPTSQPMIFIRGNIPQNGSEDIIRKIVSDKTGLEPTFMQGPLGQGMNLVMFVPI